jgi:hypothetical protein
MTNYGYIGYDSPVLELLLLLCFHIDLPVDTVLYLSVYIHSFLQFLIRELFLDSYVQ